jgi:hypothetical protein
MRTLTLDTVKVNEVQGDSKTGGMKEKKAQLLDGGGVVPSTLLLCRCQARHSLLEASRPAIRPALFKHGVISNCAS